MDLWCRSWTDWAQHAYQWQQTATSQELWLCARLLIPQSLVGAIPPTERHKLRMEVGLFQFRMIQAVQTLRQKLADPTPHQPPSPLWLTKYVAHTLPPRETPQNLRNHVGAPMRSGTKRKRRNEVATAEPIDSYQWVRDARAANNDEAVAWFTSMRATNTAPKERNPEASASQRSRTTLGAVQSDRRQVDTGTRTANTRHIPQRTHRSGGSAAPTHPARILHQHTNCQNRLPHAGYSTAQGPYGCTTTARHTHTHMCQVCRQWYKQAKYDTVTWYADAKMSLLICGRYKKRCHRQTAGPSPPTGTLHVQEHLANMTQCYLDACRHKTTQYWHTTRHAR